MYVWPVRLLIEIRIVGREQENIRELLKEVLVPNKMGMGRRPPVHSKAVPYINTTQRLRMHYGP